MADRDPGKVTVDVNWREVARLVLTSREMDRIEEAGARSGEEGPLPVQRARPRLGAGAARAAAEGWRRRLRLLSLAARAACAGSAARRRARFRHGPRRRLFQRPRYWRRLQLSEPGGAHALPMAAASGRNILRLQAGPRRSPTSSMCSRKDRWTRFHSCSAAMLAARLGDFGLR